MSYAKIENDLIVEYPVYEGDIRLRYSNVSFAVPFSPPDGYELVEDVAPPNVDYTKKLFEGTPVRINGKLQRNWIVEPRSEEELSEMISGQWMILRKSRNILLKESDWTQLSDSPAVKETWAVYRQALRDITQTTTNPFDVIWPTPPEE